MKVQFSMKWARIALFCFLELLSRQIVYRDNCWRNIFNCWRRVGQKLLKNWSKREGVFLFRLRVFLFCHSERSEESEYITSAFFRYAQQLVRSFASLWMTWCLVLNFFRFENTLHSLHGYCNPLNINAPQWHVLVFLMSLMSLSGSSDMSDIRILSSLHWEVLIIKELHILCNECNEF